MQDIDESTLAAHSLALRKDQGALRRRYRVEAPGEALVTDAAASMAHGGESPMWGSVQVGTADFGVAVPVGVHRAVGGRHDLPVPGDLLCAALVACVDTTIRILSNNLRVPLESLTVEVQADCDVRGTLRVDSSVPVGFQTMRVRVKAIPGPGVSPEKVGELIRTAEQCCVVLQTLQRGVEVILRQEAPEATANAPGIRPSSTTRRATANEPRTTKKG